METTPGSKKVRWKSKTGRYQQKRYGHNSSNSVPLKLMFASIAFAFRAIKMAIEFASMNEQKSVGDGIFAVLMLCGEWNTYMLYIRHGCVYIYFVWTNCKIQFEWETKHMHETSTIKCTMYTTYGTYVKYRYNLHVLYENVFFLVRFYRTFCNHLSKTKLRIFQIWSA